MTHTPYLVVSTTCTDHGLRATKEDFTLGLVTNGCGMTLSGYGCVTDTKAIQLWTLSLSIES